MRRPVLAILIALSLYPLPAASQDRGTARNAGEAQLPPVSASQAGPGPSGSSSTETSRDFSRDARNGEPEPETRIGDVASGTSEAPPPDLSEVVAGNTAALEALDKRLGDVEGQQASMWSNAIIFGSIAVFVLLLWAAYVLQKRAAPIRWRGFRGSGLTPPSLPPAILRCMGLPEQQEEAFEAELRDAARQCDMRAAGQDFEAKATRMILALVKGVERLDARMGQLESLAPAPSTSWPAGPPPAIEELREQIAELQKVLKRLAADGPTLEPPHAPIPVSPDQGVTASYGASPFGFDPPPAPSGESAALAAELERQVRAFFRAVSIRAHGPDLIPSLQSAGRGIAEEAQTARSLEPLKDDALAQVIAAAFERLSIEHAKPALNVLHHNECRAFMQNFPDYLLIWPLAGETLDPEAHFEVQSDAAQGQQISLVVRPGFRRGNVVLMRALVRLAA
jgi:hypothetical protein